MSAEEFDPLTPGERAELERWREATPSPALEQRIVGALRADGAIAAPARRRTAALAAAAMLIFAAGVAAGRALPRETPLPATEQRVGIERGPAAPGLRRFMLLLTAAPAVDAGEEAARVKEYGAWAAGLTTRGALATGEKLGDGGATLTPAGTVTDEPPPDDLQGFFIIVAADLAQAVAVARTCPHLRHGGRVRVRAIE
jgi:hypothetical protein